MVKGRYLPVLSKDEEEDQEKKSSWNSSSETIFTNNCCFIIYISTLIISLITNVLLFLHHFPHNCAVDHGKTLYSGLTFDTLIPYHTSTDYWGLDVNQSISDASWDVLDTNPMAISLHDNYAKKVGLGPSTRFPWDTERSIYYLKGFHDLHCLKLIRKAIVAKQHGENLTFELDHAFHCLDGLRQDIMCTADDTPMPAKVSGHVGDGQVRQCRDWEKMKQWATRPDQHACYQFDDYREATNTLELFAFCPIGSPYRSVAKAYFEYHGHKDPYEVKTNRNP